MVGLRSSASVRMRAASAMASRLFSSCEAPATRRIQLRSAPAEKDLPDAREHDAADAVLGLHGAKRLGELGDEGVVEGVVAIGTVEGDEADGALAFDGDVGGHGQ